MRSIAATLATLLVAAAPAAAHSGRSAPLVLHPGFRLAAAHVAQIWTSGDLVFYERDNTIGSTLLDETTGSRAEIERQGCAVPQGPGTTNRVTSPFGGPWVFLTCGTNVDPAIALYSLSDHGWRDVRGSPQVDQPHCGLNDSPCGAYPIEVGSEWVEFDQTCYHCSDTYVFQNLHSGAVVGDPTRPTTIADLNSPALGRKLCSPLRVPVIRNAETDQRYYGTVTFYGSFAVVAGTSDFVEKCGVRLHVPVDPAGFELAGNASALLWGTFRSALNGIFLPSLRRFTIVLPRRLHFPVRVAMTRRTLYVLDAYDMLWSTPSPRPRTNT